MVNLNNAAAAEPPLPELMLVEDDPDQREELADFLRLSGFTVHEADSAEALWPALVRCRPRLFVLDIGLPGASGISLVDELRQRYGLAIGIVMVTARGFRNDKLDARSAGADDYLVKPVDFDELLVVLNNLQRRLQHSAAPEPVEMRWRLLIGDWSLLAPNGQTLSLSEPEFRLVQVLIAACGEAVERRQIVVELGHDLAYYDLRRLDVLISRLRQKVHQQLGLELPVRTVHGVGYAFLGAS